MFFSQNWYAWLVSNLSSRNNTNRFGDWQLIFGVGLWYIWKKRCNRTLGGNQGNWYGTVLAIRRMVGNSKMVQGRSYGEMTGDTVNNYIGWKYPAEGWIKLNIDGCSKGNPGLAGAGGVIRDHMGNWIGGFARNIGICSSVTAELWAVHDGLQLTWNTGIRRVVLESDSKVVVKLIKNGSGGVDTHYNLIMQIKAMLGREWDVEILHVHREANYVADWLTNFGLGRDLLDRGSDVITEPPSGIYPLLYFDLIGSTIPREI